MSNTVEALDWLYEKGSEELELGEYESARKRFQKIIQMTRKSQWVEKANAGLAEVYWAQDNLFWAMDHIRRALKRNPYESYYRYIKASIHYSRNEWEKSADEALKCVEGDTECGQYYQLLGKAVYECADYGSARRFLEWAIECDPGNVDIRLDLVRIDIKEGNFQRALKLLKRSLEETSEADERILKNIRAIQENWEITGA